MAKAAEQTQKSRTDNSFQGVLKGLEYKSLKHAIHSGPLALALLKRHFPLPKEARASSEKSQFAKSPGGVFRKKKRLCNVIHFTRKELVYKQTIIYILIGGQGHLQHIQLPRQWLRPKAVKDSSLLKNTF